MTPVFPASLVLDFIAVASYVTAVYLSVLVPLVPIIRWWCHGPLDPWGGSVAVLLVLLTFIPLSWTESRFARAFIQFSAARAAAYFSARVVVECPESLRPGSGALLAFEPHSSLPLALPLVFNTHCHLLPKELRGRTHGAASSVCFQVPFVRQLWWWLGLRPVTRASLTRLLRDGAAVVLVPGGVQEVLQMEPACERVYLHSRTGFVRLAMQLGVPLVPVFAFGQHATYSWWRPGPPWLPAGVVSWLSRNCGAVPIFMYGAWGTPMPHRRPMTVVIGRALPVPHVVHPTDAEVRQQLDAFIAALQALYEAHKDACGHADRPLVVL